MITGRFSTKTPTLNESQFNQEMMTKMNCLDNPQSCPW
jgi:hypothetical protein